MTRSEDGLEKNAQRVAPKFDGIGGGRGHEGIRKFDISPKFDNLTGGPEIRQNLTYYPALSMTMSPRNRGGVAGGQAGGRRPAEEGVGNQVQHCAMRRAES